MNKAQLRLSAMTPRIQKIYKEKYAEHMTPGQFLILVGLKRGRNDKL